MPSLIPRPHGRIVSFPDPPRKAKRGSGVLSKHFLSHGAGPYFVKNVIIAFLYLHGTQVSDTSVYMDYYTARFATARDGREAYWDSRKQAARQVFTISDSFQNTIAYVMQIFAI